MQKNEKNEPKPENIRAFADFFSYSYFIKKNNDQHVWPGNFNLSEVIIESIPVCTSTTEIISFICYTNKRFLLENEEVLLLLKKLETWNYDKLAISVLFFYLKTQYDFKKKPLGLCDWLVIIPVIIQPDISNSVFVFLNKMELAELLIKTNTESQFLKALIFHLQDRFSSAQGISNLLGITNILKFLKVEQILIDSLIEKTYKEKTFHNIVNFLKTYRS